VTRIGLIGLGYRGPHYARVVTEVATCELRVICDACLEAVAFTHARVPHARTTTVAQECSEAATWMP
jgi:hypothetical protein